MVTARQEPRLVLVSVGCENGCLALSAPGMEPLRLPVRLPRKNPVRNCRYGGREAGGLLLRPLSLVIACPSLVRLAFQVWATAGVFLFRNLQVLRVTPKANCCNKSFNFNLLRGGTNKYWER